MMKVGEKNIKKFNCFFVKDNSNRYYPDPPVTSEETRRERYHQSSEGFDDLPPKEQKKSKTRKKNIGTLFNENHATSTSTSTFFLAWLSFVFAQTLS